MKKVLIILGPTGIGKSEVGIYLAKKFNGEIISADSVQVYKYFDIGSAKITQEQMQGIKHYGIDILQPNEEFNAHQFIQYTKDKINEISERNHLPIIVGGTALYIRALVENYNLGATQKHEEFREKLENEIEKDGLETVYNKLVQLDKDLAKKTDKHNKVRVIRAMEIATFGGEKSFSQNDDQYEYKIFALCMDRQSLYERINLRADKMLDEGIITETQNIIANYGYDLSPLKAIGYKEVVSYLKNEIDKDTMLSLIKQHSRNYAKRQMTFLRSMKNVTYIDVQNRESGVKSLEKEARKWLKA